MTDALTAAHTYAKRGWGVVPLYGVAETGGCCCSAGALCSSAGKHPNGRGGSWNVLRGGADVQAWFEEHPDDNVGIVTGPESGIFVLDVDGPVGIASISDLAAEHGPLPATRIVRTGSGGLHYFFRHPGHFVVHNSTSYLAAGIDIRGKGGQVVAPPSISGRGPYEVLSDADIADAPDWLLTLLAEHTERVEHGHRAEVRVAEHVDVELLPEKIATLIRQHVGMDEGRFKHFHAAVAAIYEAGYTQGQAVTLIAPWCLAVGKFVGRVEQEVARTWGKLEAESQRANEWIDGLGDRPPERTEPWTSLAPPAAPSSPDSETPAPASTSSSTSSPTEAPTSTETEVADLPASWAAVDLAAILDGTYEPEKAALFPRTDGVCLLYPGRVHSFHGESESGKSLVAQYECARVLIDGGTAAYVDFESDPATVVGRILDMGASQDAVRDRFSYRRPDADPLGTPREREAYSELLGLTADVLIIDGVTDALWVFGAGSNDMDEVTAFMRRFPRLVARRTGAAVVLIDHVAKDADTRGRHAVGSQAKLNALDGAAYTVEILEPLGRGMRGAVGMRVGKDRPGDVRPHAGTFRKTDRTQEAARLVVDSTQGGIVVTVQPPENGVQGAVLEDGRELRPGWLTTTMQRVSETLSDAGDSLSKNQLETRTKGKASSVRQALKQLIDDAFVDVVKGPRGDEFVLTRRYLSVEDELSEEYLGWAQDGSSIATSSHLVPTSSRGEGTTLVPVPLPLRGGDEVGNDERTSTSSPSEGRGPGFVEVACSSCFRPTPQVVADTWGGVCGACAQKAGLV